MKRLISLLLLSSCSLFGIQREEGPKYEVLKTHLHFEIRKYQPYIIAKTTVAGDYEKSSSKAFRILAGYIFGKNKGKQEIAMTSPVEMQATKIARTSPVEMKASDGQFSMAFSMPSKYTMKDLPEPLDDRITFELVPSKLVAIHRFSWGASQSKNDKKALELRQWLQSLKLYDISEGYTFAGYNPPWTIPFLRRNEVMIEIKLK